MPVNSMIIHHAPTPGHPKKFSTLLLALVLFFVLKATNKIGRSEARAVLRRFNVTVGSSRRIYMGHEPAVPARSEAE